MTYGTYKLPIYFQVASSPCYRLNISHYHAPLGLYFNSVHFWVMVINYFLDLVVTFLVLCHYHDLVVNGSFIKSVLVWGCLGVALVESPTLSFTSGHDLRVVRLRPLWGAVINMESA